MNKRIFMLLVGCMLSNLSIASELVERGNGTVYWKRIIKVYDAQLLADADATLDNILNDDVSKCLILSYRVSLEAKKIVIATNTVLQRQHSQEILDTVNDELKLLNDQMKATKKGDQYELCYEHQTTTLRLAFNNKLLHESQSSDLARLYLGIWLYHSEPLSQKLRLSLLK